MRGTSGTVAAVAVGLWALVGAAKAGEPQPDVVPEAQPYTGGVVLVNGIGGGCAGGGCGGAPVAPAPKTALWGIAIGAGCPNPVTCGTAASEKTFLFGSCRQFYNPGNDCTGFLAGHGGKHCGSPMVYGPGGMSDGSFCNYGSYVNR